VAVNAQKATHPNHTFFIAFALGSVRKSGDLIQENSNENNANEAIHCNFPPKSLWFLGAVYPTMKADPRFSGADPNHSRGKCDDPKHQVKIWRPYW
jgi:hypothetical protein